MTITPEQQAMQNVILKNTPPGLMVLDEAAINKASAERRAAQDAAEKKDHPPDETQAWRGELEDMTRRLQNSVTEAEAKRYADQEATKHAEAVKLITDELDHLSGLLKTEGLSRCVPLRQGRAPVSGDTCDVCMFTRKIANVEIELNRAKSAQAKSIKTCGNLINSARELDKLRPRWKELKERDGKISRARQSIKGLRDQSLREQPITSNERFVQQTGVALQSKHLRWDKD